MPGQGIAPAPGGLRQALGHPAAGTGAGFRRLSGGRLICTSWRLGFRQCSFHHVTRISRHAAPYAWALLPVSWHAVFPYVLSDFRSAIRSRDFSSHLCPLGGRYNTAPRGAVCARIGDQRQRYFVTRYPGPTTRLPDDQGIRGRMHAERRQPSADQTSLPWQLSQSVINAVDPAGTERARHAEYAIVSWTVSRPEAASRLSVAARSRT